MNPSNIIDIEVNNRKLHFVKQSMILHKDSKSSDKFMWDIHVAVARQYSNNLSEETKKGLTEKAAQGWYPGNQKRGYKTIGDLGHKIWDIDRSNRDYIYIEMAFVHYDTGNYSLKQLSKELYHQGWISSKNTPISVGELHKLLIDPFYCGEFLWHGRIYKGKHPALISREMFYRVQERLNRKTKAGKYRKHHYALGGGLTICDECGRTVVWETQKGHVYGHCTRFKTGCSQKRYFKENKVEQQIIDLLNGFKILDPKLQDWVRKALKEAHETETEYHLEVTRDLDQQILTLTQKLNKLYDDLSDGLINKDFYLEKQVDYQNKISTLNEARERHMKSNFNMMDYYYYIFELSQIGSELYDKEALINEKREMLNFIFSNFKLREDKVIPTLQNGFEVLYNCSKTGNWLGIVDSNLLFWLNSN